MTTRGVKESRRRGRSVGLVDVAREAGVSPATASRVLNRGQKSDRVGAEIVAKVQQAAERLGYIADYHHRSIRLGRAETIGLALDMANHSEEDNPLHLIGNEYWSPMIAGAEAATYEMGYCLSLIGTLKEVSGTERGLAALKQRRFDALIIPHATAETLDRLSVAAGPDPRSFPVVLVEPTRLAPGFHTVNLDERSAVDLVLGHLRELGHRNVLWLSPDSYFGGKPGDGIGREAVFARAAWEAGVQGEILRFPKPDDKDPQRTLKVATFATDAMVRRLTRPWSFTAVVCFNDRVAAGALNAFRSSGVSVPRDVSVVGFDNFASEMFGPPLTTIDFGFHLLGWAAVRALIGGPRSADGTPPRPDSRLTDHSVPGQARRIVVEPRLVVRDSTGPAPVNPPS